MSTFHNIYLSQYEKSEHFREQEALYQNFDFFDNFFTALLSTFRWENIPNEPKIQSFDLERMFQFSGRVGMISDENGKLAVYPAFPAGALMKNGEYTNYILIRGDGTQVQRKYDDIALGFNNAFKMPYYYKVRQHADNASYALRAVKTALRRAIMPSLVKAPTPALLSQLEKIRDSADEAELKAFLVTMAGKFDGNEITVDNFFDNTKNDVLALWDVFVRFRNLYYTTIGIDNVEIQKKERLTQAEGSANSEITRYTILDDMDERRTDFVRECKEKFNSDIKYEIRRGQGTTFDLSLNEDEKVEIARMGAISTTNVANTVKETEVKEDEVQER